MRTPLLTLVGTAALALPATASDLQVAGLAEHVALIGTNVPIDFQAGPNLPFLIAIDVSAGPVNIGGDLVPFGFTPQALILSAGITDNTGAFSTQLAVPFDPSFGGITLYGIGVALDPGTPSGFDFSNGVTLDFYAPPADPIAAELVGKPLAAGPLFQWVTSTREGDAVHVGIDSRAYPFLVGQEVDIYVVPGRTEIEWASDPSLSDVTAGGVTTVTIVAGGLAGNVIEVDPGSLSGDAGAGFGVGYDVIVDINRNGVLDGGDLIDGIGAIDGFYVCHDPTLPGPYAVSSTTYSGGTWLGQILYWPSNIAELDDLPLVIVSHGNGHNYLWYAHLGNHLASYGYVVMSHQNNTGPGVVTASTTTLTNTDYLLGNLGSIAGGALQGKLDTSRITWIGHSRGGEGIAIAYDRILKGLWVPEHYSLGDLRLLSSMAPTDFQGPNQTNPHAVDYHLWVVEADADVNGCTSPIAKPPQIWGRATDQRSMITLYGAGHGDLHNGGGSSVAAGPCQIGRPLTHLVMRGHVLPLVEHHIRDNPAAKDWLRRPYEDLPPPAAPVGVNPCLIVNLQYRDTEDTNKLVLDNFEGGANPTLASSGANVTSNLLDHTVARLQDPNNSFAFIQGELLNGMTYARVNDFEAGAIFRFEQQDSFLSYTLRPNQQDLTPYNVLSLRMAQQTRHPLTVAQPGPVTFSVRLTDRFNTSATLRLDELEQSIPGPYLRGGCGIGQGWSNQFRTVRLHLDQFLAVEPNLDLSLTSKVELLFGPSHGSAFGFLGLDDIEFLRD
jgi:hypothetical protein